MTGQGWNGSPSKAGNNREESDGEMEAFQFDWDVANARHLAQHDILPAEAEQVLKNRPRDIESQLRNGEERVAQVARPMKAEFSSWFQLCRTGRFA